MRTPTPPPEPFVRDTWWGRNAFWAHTKPRLLLAEGVLVLLAGPAFVAYLGSVAAGRGDAPGWFVPFLAVLGFVFVVLGALLVYSGVVRGRWEREYERVMGYRPGPGAPR